MGPVADDNGTNKQYRDANTANLALEKGEEDFSLSQEILSLTRKVVFLPRIYFYCPGYILPAQDILISASRDFLLLSWSLTCSLGRGLLAGNEVMNLRLVWQ